MPKKTDMAGLRDLAKTFLHFEPVSTPFAPVVIKHPFTDSALVGIRQPDGSHAIGNILDSQEDMQAWRKQQSEVIDRVKSPLLFAFMVTNSYALGFLKYAQQYLSKEDLSEMLAYMWVNTEAPNQDCNLSKTKLLSMFKAADPKSVMTEEEYQKFQNLDEQLTIYRGVTSHNADNIKALSWTLDPDKAFWFAHRFGEEGTVYEAQINKKHVYAYFEGRNEAEVIVDPKHLTDITQLQEQSQGFAMAML